MFILPLLLAGISGAAIVWAVAWLIGIAIIAYLVWIFIDYIGAPQPIDKLLRIAVIGVAVLFAINALLTPVDMNFISW